MERDIYIVIRSGKPRTITLLKPNNPAIPMTKEMIENLWSEVMETDVESDEEKLCMKH